MDTASLKDGLVPDESSEMNGETENCVYLNPGAFEGAKDGDAVKFQGEGVYRESEEGPKVEVVSINNQPVASEAEQPETSEAMQGDLAEELKKLGQ
jgi:hypothetical protein